MSTDGSRQVADSATRRYARLGRAWARESIARATAVIHLAADPHWSGKIVGTFWANVFETAHGVREGVRIEETLAEHTAARTQLAQMVADKGSGPVFSAATTAAGSTDAECTARTGLFLDSDFSGDWSRIVDVLSSARVAFVGQRRQGKKFHLVLPYAKPLVPPKTFKPWKQEYMRRLGWLLGALSEIAWPGDDSVYFDPATTRLCTLEYVYCRRAENEAVPETISSGNMALDWGRFHSLSRYADWREREKREASTPIRSPSDVAAEAPGPSEKQWTEEPVRARLMDMRQWKARARHRDPRDDAQFVLLDRVLRGQAFASPHGRPVDGVEYLGRHEAIVQLAGVLARALHEKTPDRIVYEIVQPAFAAVDWSDASAGRAADDWGHGLQVFAEKFADFRGRLPGERQLVDYRFNNQIDETLRRQ